MPFYFHIFYVHVRTDAFQHIKTDSCMLVRIKTTDCWLQFHCTNALEGYFYFTLLKERNILVLEVFPGFGSGMGRQRLMFHNKALKLK